MSYHLVSQLSHVEMYTPKPEESLRFFEEVLRLQESQREGQSVWLRAWGEFFHHSRKVTEGPASGIMWPGGSTVPTTWISQPERWTRRAWRDGGSTATSGTAGRTSS